MVVPQILPTRGLSLDGSFRPALWREAKELLDASASGIFGSQLLMEKTSGNRFINIHYILYKVI
jgi:hypothetical protein